MSTEEKVKNWISPELAAKKIQPDWTHRKLREFLVKRKFVEQHSSHGSIVSPEQIRFGLNNYKLDPCILTEDFEIAENFIDILIDDFYKMIDEDAHEEWLQLELDQLANRKNEKIEHLKMLEHLCEVDYKVGVEQLVRLGLKL